MSELRARQGETKHADINTSKSRLAVDREFVYIGAAGLGRAGGRVGGREEGTF